MACPTIPWKLALTALALALAIPTVRAQGPTGIKWRSNYNEARQEAEAKNLPLLIDFITTPCLFCDKLDRETFADSRVANLINQKFIPLKINNINEENKTTSLVTFLQVHLYPTIVLAGPDGQIMLKKEGFHDASQLHELMQQTLAKLTPTDAMQEKYQAAVKHEANGDFVRAINNLHDIVDDAKPRPIKKKAEELLKKIENAAADRLAKAKELETKGQNQAALEAYTEVLRSFPGLPAGREATELIAKLARTDKELPVIQRNKHARELLTQARSFYKSKDYILCLDRCEIVLSDFGDLPEGREAFLLASEIKNNREWIQGAADVMTDRLGSLLLALADIDLKQGEVRRAQNYLQRVIGMFPGSRLAESAQIRLNQLQATVPIAGNRPQ